MTNWFGYGGRIHTWGDGHPVQRAIVAAVFFGIFLGVVQLFAEGQNFGPWSIAGLVGGAVVFGLIIWFRSRKGANG